MNKAAKRIQKCAFKRPFVDCLVIGTGMGAFDELFDLFDTVFVYDKGAPRVRRSNVVYKAKLKDNDNEEQKGFNRRVEIQVLKK